MKTILLLIGYLYLFNSALEVKDVDLADFQTSQGFTIKTTNSQDVIASAGDINKDGFPDTIIGTPYGMTSSMSGSGLAYILFGRQGGFTSAIDLASWNSSLGIKIDGLVDSEGNMLGTSVGYAGDLNHDGIDDIFVSAPSAVSGGGAVYIIFGKDGLSGNIDIASLTVSEGIKITISSGNSFGFLCSRLGDINGDSYDDLAIAAFDDNTGRKGEVYIIFGKPGLASNIDLSSTSLSATAKGFKITGASNADQVGNAISSADVTGDGINDIILGARSASPNGVATSGIVYLIFGANGLSGDIDLANPLGSKGIQIIDNTPNLQIGYALSSGDFNGDSISDIAVGSITSNNLAGAVYIIFGKDISQWSDLNLDTWTAADGITITGANTGDRFGSFLIASAPRASPSSRSTAGIVYGILGKANGLSDISLATFDTSLGTTIFGSQSNAKAGNTMSTVGDLDGDGQDDLIIQSSQGSYLLYVANFQIQPPNTNTGSGNGNGSTSANNDTDAEMIQRIVDYQITAGIIVAATTSGLQMSQSGSMAVITAVLLAKQIQYIRYLDLGYSSRLTQTFQKQPYNLVTVNFGPLFPGSLKEEAFRSPAPSRFAKYINGLLVTNFWRGLTTLGILLIVLSIALILRRIDIKNEKLRLVKDKLLSFILCNYMFSFILTNADNIILFSSVNYESFNLDGGLATASFVISILCLLGLLVILVFIPYHLYRLRKHKKYQCKEDKLKAHDSSKVLFEEVKDKYFIQELYLFVICFRAVLHNIIVGALDNPTLQCSLLIVINVLMMIYMISMRPHRKMITNIEVVGYEIFILIANITCLSIAQLDSADQPYAIASGDVIIVCNILIITFSMVISISKVVLSALPTIKEKLAARKNKLEQAPQTPLTGPLSPETQSAAPLKIPEPIEFERDSLLTVADVDVEDVADLASSKMQSRITSALKPMNTVGRDETDRELIDRKRMDTYAGNDNQRDSHT